MNEVKIDPEQKDKIRNALYRIPKDIWPEIYWDLRYECWPDELEIKPIHVKEECEFLSKVIWSCIGNKPLLRYLNVSTGNMSDKMFDDLWDSSRDKAQYNLHSDGGEHAKDSANQTADNGNSPIVTKLVTFLLGGVCGLLTSLLLLLLKFL